MRLKKIISALAAISMLSSFGFTCANAEHATNPIIHVYVTEADNIEEKTYYKVPDGYTPYMISYSIEGIDSSLNMINGLAISYKVSAEDLAKIDAKSFSKSKTTGATSGRDLNGVYADNTGALQVISNQQISFASTDGIDITDWDTYPDGSADESLRFIDTLWYVQTGESVTINYTSEVVGGQTTSKIVLDDDTSFAGEIVFDNPTVVLGGSSVVDVESVTLDKTELTLDLNGSTSAKLTATVAPADASNPTVTWSTSAADVATVAEDGTVTAVAVGTATITAKAGDKSATCAVTVKDSTPPADPKGTVIQGADVIYAGSAAAATITAATKFQIEYTGSDESIKQPNGTKVKNISRTAEDILGGVIGEGSLTGTVHFGIKVPASVVGTDEAKHFQINVIND